METMAETPSRTASVMLPAAGGGASRILRHLRGEAREEEPGQQRREQTGEKKSRPVRALPNRMAPV